jgi:hypothetical protein
MTKVLLPAIVILTQATAFADGGAVHFRQETGDLVITLFTVPARLSVGPVDISLLLQNRNGLDPVLDADVFLKASEDVSGIEFNAHPTRAKATNKLLYAVPVMFARPGKWRIAVRVKANVKRRTQRESLRLPRSGRVDLLRGLYRVSSRHDLALRGP